MIALSLECLTIQVADTGPSSHSHSLLCIQIASNISNVEANALILSIASSSAVFVPSRCHLGQFITLPEASSIALVAANKHIEIWLLGFGVALGCANSIFGQKCLSGLPLDVLPSPLLSPHHASTAVHHDLISCMRRDG